MKLLLAIDGSEASQAAVAEVAARPWPGGTHVEVLSVVEPAHMWEMSITAQEANRRAHELVQRAATKLSSAKLDAEGTVLAGDPKTVILDHAAEFHTDLIVLGSHGGNAMKRFLLGNTAAAVARHAPCALEIVRARKSSGGGFKILLATDGSEFSQAAARSIAARPWPAGAEVRVLSILEYDVPPVQALLEPPFIHSDQLDKIKEDAMRHAQQAVAEAMHTLEPSGLSISESISVLLGGPRDVILQDAQQWGANLIVVGSHGRRGVDRFLMGSVSEGVATHAPCSVEVIRAAAS